MGGTLAYQEAVSTSPLFWMALMGVAMGPLLWVEKREYIPGKLLFKPLASTVFILAAVASGALKTRPGQWVFAGLVFSYLGDVALIFSHRVLFLSGLVVFLLGHVMYVAAFWQGDVDGAMAAGAVVPLVGIAMFIYRWLAPHLGRLKGPVVAYIVVISVMVASAAGLLSSAHGAWIFLGAVLFFVSDICVARDRFVTQGFLINRGLGLPLYYGGQLVLALYATRI